MRFKMTGAAAAASLLASMAPAVAQAPMAMGDWSGFYIGANVGAGTQNTNFSYNPAIPGGPAGALTTTSGNFNHEGPFGGGTLGYNWQFGPGWVWGLEGDIDGDGNRGYSTCVPTTTAHCSLANNWVGTVRGRLGWLAMPNAMLFVTGGAAFGDIKTTAPGPTNNDTTNVGWTAGAGLEYMFAPQWSVKLEYRDTGGGYRWCGDLGEGRLDHRFCTARLQLPLQQPAASAAGSDGDACAAAGGAEGVHRLLRLGQRRGHSGRAADHPASG
jgi:outer membrane immunogenic protein